MKKEGWLVVIALAVVVLAVIGWFVLEIGDDTGLSPPRLMFRKAIIPIPQPCADDCYSTGSWGCPTDNVKAICGQFDSDSCRDWGNITECDAGYSCSNGSCVQDLQGLPDLYPSEANITLRRVPVNDSADYNRYYVDITAKVTNKGNAIAGSSRIRYYVSCSGIYGTCPSSYWDVIPSLGPGESSPIVGDSAVIYSYHEPSPIRPVTVSFEVDFENVVNESNEQNNNVTRTWTTSVP